MQSDNATEPWADQLALADGEVAPTLADRHREPALRVEPAFEGHARLPAGGRATQIPLSILH